jgi:hypothetical protein
MANKKKRQATLRDWCIVSYPDICTTFDNSAAAFAKYTDKTVVVLIGRAANDSRYNAKTGNAFEDGNMLLTSPVMRIDGNEYHTIHTIYILSDAEMNEKYRKWCEENP